MGIVTWSDQVCMVILIPSGACSIPGLERPQAGPFRVSAAADPDDLIRPIDHLDAAPASPATITSPDSAHIWPQIGNRGLAVRLG